MIRLAVVVALAACSSPAKPDPGKPMPTKADDPTCPVLVAGTSVTVEDTDQGAAFVFATTSDVAAVRTRATALATMHNGHPAHGMQMGAMIGTPSTAAAADLPTGARVTFTATDTSNAGKLQAELRAHAHHLASGSCDM